MLNCIHTDKICCRSLSAIVWFLFLRKILQWDHLCANKIISMFVEANPQQENNFVVLSPFHSIFVIYTPSMLSERVSVSSCSEKETMCFVTR